MWTKKPLDKIYEVGSHFKVNLSMSKSIGAADLQRFQSSWSILRPVFLKYSIREVLRMEDEKGHIYELIIIN